MKNTPKHPPHSIEAEMSVLGGMLLDNRKIDDVTDLLEAKDFYTEAHQLLYRVIVELNDQRVPTDFVTLSEHLRKTGELERVGGLSALGALVNDTPSAANLKAYAEIVRERAVMRSLIAAGLDTAELGYRPEGRTVPEMIDEAEQKMLAIRNRTAKTTAQAQTMATLMSAVTQSIEDASKREDPIMGQRSGFVDLDNATTGFYPGDLIIVAGRPSMGKAQPLDAKVLTSGGFIRMGDINVGDQLASIDGDDSVVTGIFKQGVIPQFRITLNDGRSTLCSENHLWRVTYRDWDKPRIIETREVARLLTKKRYKNRIWLDSFSGSFGDEAELPLDPWLLGILIGDGSLSDNSPRFSSADTEIVERVASSVPDSLEVKHIGAYDYRIVGKDGRTGGKIKNAVQQELIRIGLNGKRSQDKFIPAEYLAANHAQRVELLSGLIDTDGWIEKFGAIRFCTVSKKLADDVQWLVRSLGGSCSVCGKKSTYTYRGEKKNGRDSYVCNIQFPGQCPLRLISRKQKLILKFRRKVRPTIKSVEPAGVAEMQCISVSHPSKLYVTDEFIVTHNTTFALNMGEYAATRENKRVLVFSMEMSAAQLAMRALASQSRVPFTNLRTGRLNDKQWDSVAGMAGVLREAPLLIDEAGALSPMDVRSRARRIHARSPLSLIIVDYIQLMQVPGSKDNRTSEMSEISRNLKALAKELGVPIVVLSQLNRGVENRDNKRPRMADLRESGGIEQDADIILLLYRDEYYNPDSAERGIAEIIISKQRNGPLETVRVRFDGTVNRFSNLATNYGSHQ